MTHSAESHRSLSADGTNMEVKRSGSQNSGLQLPPALQPHILSFLPPNDRALSGRLVSPDAAAALSEDPTCTASLSQLLSPHAAPWAVEAGRQHVMRLPFRHKLQLLCSAAASGREANLEVALALLQPNVFLNVLHQTRNQYPNPGVAAVEAGHPQLLGWLVRHCPALLGNRRDILRAAARHCNLAGLQAAALSCRNSTADLPLMNQDLLDWVAASPVDAEAKVEWVLAEGGGSCSLQESTAAAAARSGDLGRLRWLRERGCPMGGLEVLQSALQHADLAVARWLVGEAGCKLPAPAGEEWQWARLLEAAAKSPDGVPKLQWLWERGAPPPNDMKCRGTRVRRLLSSAAGAGRVEVVRHLLPLREALSATQRCSLVSLDHDLLHCAAASGSVPMMDFLRQAGCTPGCAAYDAAALAAAHRDHLAGCNSIAMFRWLLQEAGVSAVGFNLVTLLQQWPNDTPTHSRDLLQVVQLLVGQAGCTRWNAEAALQTAAKRGDLALVQYLLQQPPQYQPDWGLLVSAVQGGCLALLEWLVEQYPECLVGTDADVSPYVPAAMNGDLGTLTALRRLGVPWGEGDVVAQAVREGTGVEALQWLEEHGGRTGGILRGWAEQWVADSWTEDSDE